MKGNGGAVFDTYCRNCLEGTLEVEKGGYSVVEGAWLCRNGPLTRVENGVWKVGAWSVEG